MEQHSHIHKKIAVFDSGIGGLTVLRDLYQLLPGEDYYYYADTKNVPYGLRSKEEIMDFMEEAVGFLMEQNIKLLVIACNSATSVAIKKLREKYDFPIVGMEPAVKPALENHHNKKVLITATSITLREEKLKNLISTTGHSELVEKLALDELVQFAEAFNFNGDDVQGFLLEKFGSLDLGQYSSLVLGCTHFIYYKEMIWKIVGRHAISIIDGNEGTVRQVQSILRKNQLLSEQKNGRISYYRSGDPVADESIIRKMDEVITR